MYRVVRMPSKAYAMKVDLLDDIDNIREFVECGDVVILCNELLDLEFALGIEEEDIEVVT